MLPRNAFLKPANSAHDTLSPLFQALGQRRRVSEGRVVLVPEVVSSLTGVHVVQVTNELKKGSPINSIPCVFGLGAVRHGGATAIWRPRLA